MFCPQTVYYTSKAEKRKYFTPGQFPAGQNILQPVFCTPAVFVILSGNLYNRKNLSSLLMEYHPDDSYAGAVIYLPYEIES